MSEITLSLSARLEALLFVAPEAVSMAQLAEALRVEVEAVQQALAALEENLKGRGIRLLHHGGKIQMTTAPEVAAEVERFLNLEATTSLSRAALETLALIAYRQPITRPQVEAVRGVNSDGVIKSLLSKGLIQEAGRAEGPGRPILYVTTPAFLQHFGLRSLEELPPLELPEAEADDPNKLLKG
uniref:Segregation and condensation protein B n=1 Tax=uncultured Chloroflexota bacterium TaxID=166587 RepID=H5S9A3_9CHLR|nr:segregation and condensation protein B [uncultured Chloroflexota bacterium]